MSETMSLEKFKELQKPMNDLYNIIEEFIPSKAKVDESPSHIGENDGNPYQQILIGGHAIIKGVKYKAFIKIYSFCPNFPMAMVVSNP